MNRIPACFDHVGILWRGFNTRAVMNDLCGDSDAQNAGQGNYAVRLHLFQSKGCITKLSYS